MAAIEVSDLWVRYGDRDAVRGISLSVEGGSTTAVLGRNGAGKTSTIESIEGYRRIARGSVKVLGLDPVRDRTQLLPQIGVMLQVGGIYPRMNPREALKLYSGFYDSPVAVEELIAKAELSNCAATPYRFLSGGEKQRLALALALIGRPKVLFLDEPTAGVDPAGKAQIRVTIAEMAKSGVAVLMTTHELAEAERLCDEIVVIDEGRIVATGSPNQLRQEFGRTVVSFRTALPVDTLDLTAKLGISITALGDGSYRLEEGAPASIVGMLSAVLAEAGIELIELNAGRSSLEEIFLEITGNDE